jgi:hypothetical protein
VAALKQSLAQNQKRLTQYQWIETTIVSMKGEEKSRVQKQCLYGPDGKVQKQEISAPAPQESQRGLRGRMIAKKKGEITDYMQQAVALIHQYGPTRNAFRPPGCRQSRSPPWVPVQCGSIYDFVKQATAWPHH